MGCISSCVNAFVPAQQAQPAAQLSADDASDNGEELEFVQLVPGGDPKGKGRHNRRRGRRRQPRHGPRKQPRRDPGANQHRAASPPRPANPWSSGNALAAARRAADASPSVGSGAGAGGSGGAPATAAAPAAGPVAGSVTPGDAPQPVPVQDGPDTCAAFFFPDKALPCRNWANGFRCRRRNCRYSHEATSLTALCSFLDGADDTLDICVYIITLNSIVDSLLAAHERGVKIRIITDDDQAKKQGFTTTNEARSRTSNRNYLNRMREVGIPIRTDASPAHMHNKFCIVDGDLLVTGSFNWTMGAALRNQENIVVVGAGAGAAAASVIPLYKQEFLRLWHTFGRRNAAQYDPSTVSRKLIPAQPQGRRYDCLFFPDAALPCRNYARGRCHNPNCRYAHGETGLTRMVSYLESAQTSLDVCVLTITCDEISNALLAAHKRGVRVRIISDDEQAIRSGSDVVRLANAGVPVRTDRGAAHMHHKFCVVDGTLLMTGSFNWTASAVTRNQENLLVLEGVAGSSAAFMGKHVQLAALFTEHFGTMWDKYAGNDVRNTAQEARQRVQAQGGERH